MPNRSVRTHQRQILSAAVKLEIRMKRAVVVDKGIVARIIDLLFVRGEYNQVSLGGDCDPCRERPFLQIVPVVGQIPSVKTDESVIAVVKLDPVGVCSDGVPLRLISIDIKRTHRRRI